MYIIGISVSKLKIENEVVVCLLKNLLLGISVILQNQGNNQINM